MTPEQAFNILAEVCGLVKATRAEHATIQQALMVLRPKVEKVEQKTNDNL